MFLKFYKYLIMFDMAGKACPDARWWTRDQSLEGDRNTLQS